MSVYHDLKQRTSDVLVLSSSQDTKHLTISKQQFILLTHVM